MLYFEKFRFLIFLLVTAIFQPFLITLFAQENTDIQDTVFVKSESFPIALQQNQDSILDEITDIQSVLFQKNHAYVSNDSLDNELRYYRVPSNQIPRSFMEILRNPYYDELGYKVTLKDTVIVNPLFLPVVFTGKIVPDNISFPAYDISQPGYTFNPPGLKGVNPFEKEMYIDELRRGAYLYFTNQYPYLVKYLSTDLPKNVPQPEPLKVNVFTDLFKVENAPDFSGVTGPEKYDPGRKYWFFSGNSLMQVSQNYISKNWYKGGISNLNILSSQIFNYNYSKDKIRFNNELRWDLSLYMDTATNKIGTDLLRTYSDFGIQAFGKWFYSTNLEMKTQVFDNYKDNAKTILVSTFAAPFFINMGILGMKYSLDKSYKNNKYKKLQVNADISPLSVKYVFCGNSRVDSITKVVNYGIPNGKNSYTQFGSLINSTFVMTFNRQVTFTSRFKYFTTFEKVEMESENTLDMKLNRYFSTRIYCFFRFDDTKGIVRNDKLGYFQVNELLSFGFNYKW